MKSTGWHMWTLCFVNIRMKGENIFGQIVLFALIFLNLTCLEKEQTSCIPPPQYVLLLIFILEEMF